MKSTIEKLLEVEVGELIALPGEISNRKYYRVITKDQKKYIACYSGDLEVHKKFIHTTDLYTRLNIRVPKIKGIENNLLVLEDIGDISLRSFLYNKNESIIKETYFNILQSLSSLHYHPSSDKESLKIYDLDWKLREIGMTVEYYENNLRHNNYRADKIVAIFRNILKKVDHPLGICHRDLQTKNIYWKNNEIIFIDHQDSFRSPGIYDLASILEDPYFRVNDKIKNEVKSYSFKLFNQYQVGSKISIEQFLDDYAVYAVQRLYKAIGSYAKVFYDHRNPRYLEFISNAFANIRDLVTCHPVLSDLEFLVKDYYEL